MKRKVVALTGKIGSGKSTVAKILAEKHFPVVDCDRLSRQVAQDKNVLLQVENLLGAKSVVDGKLNRKFVRETVFADENLHERYSAIFWNRIKQLLDEKISQTEGLVFVEIPVIAAFEYHWDEIWCVESSVDDIVRRVTARDGVNEENVLSVLKMQNTCPATKTISNNGTLDELQIAVERALQCLILE